MSYDVMCRGPHEELDALWAEHVRAHNAGDHDRAVEAYATFKAARDDAHAYFACNNAGMQALRQIMDKANALDMTQPPEWPVWPEGVPRDAEPPHTYAEAVEKVRAYGGESGMIPVWKLCSNDYWVISANEARATARALSNYIGRLDGGDKAFAERWLSFLRHVARHHGATVA